jgi:hypothetical protein
VYVRALTGGRDRWPISTDGGVSATPTVVLTVNAARGTRAMVERDVAEAAWLPAMVPPGSIR